MRRKQLFYLHRNRVIYIYGEPRRLFLRMMNEPTERSNSTIEDFILTFDMKEDNAPILYQNETTLKEYIP